MSNFPRIKSNTTAMQWQEPGFQGCVRAATISPGRKQKRVGVCPDPLLPHSRAFQSQCVNAQAVSCEVTDSASAPRAPELSRALVH